MTLLRSSPKGIVSPDQSAGDSPDACGEETSFDEDESDKRANDNDSCRVFRSEPCHFDRVRRAVGASGVCAARAVPFTGICHD